MIAFLGVLAVMPAQLRGQNQVENQAPPSKSTPPSTATGSPASPQDVTEIEKRLGRISEQIKDLRARIEAESKNEATILSTLARINLNKSLIERELASLSVQSEKARTELAAIQQRARTVQSDIDRDNAAVERTLVTLYKFGPMNALQLVLQAKNLETYSTESKRLSILARYQDKTIAAYVRSLEELRASQKKIEEKRRDLAEIARTSGLKKQELDAEERKNAALVREIQQSKRTHEETVRELGDSAEQLQLMMKRLATKEWALPSTFVPLSEMKGKLAWPLDGRVITSFGIQRSPQFATIVMNNGIEIAPRKDKSIIQAVHAGKVVYADYFQGYGNLLIIDHGLTYYSLYGHCSEFLVGVGEMVAANQPVALVGDTGSLHGECLYFEIRHKTKALEPLQWLKRR